MKLTKTKKSINRKTNVYVLTVETMTGDADDTHYLRTRYQNEEELKHAIIAFEILTRCYPNGRGGGAEYVGAYFEDYCDGIYYTDYGMSDSIENYEISYFDDEGVEYTVSVEFDEEMVKEIQNPKLSEDELRKMRYIPKNLPKCKPE